MQFFEWRFSNLLVYRRKTRKLITHLPGGRTNNGIAILLKAPNKEETSKAHKMNKMTATRS